MPFPIAARLATGNVGSDGRDCWGRDSGGRRIRRAYSHPAAVTWEVMRHMPPRAWASGMPLRRPSAKGNLGSDRGRLYAFTRRTRDAIP